MLFTLAVFALLGLLGLVLLTVRESPVRVSQMLRDLDARPETKRAAAAEQPSDLTPTTPEAGGIDELNFTRSLLALSTIHLQARGDSPKPESGESSSWELVRHARSKNPGQEL